MKRKRVLVIGLGNYGTAITLQLWHTGADVVVLDRDAMTVDALKDRTHAAFVGDATDPAVLERVGARELDVAVVTFGEAFESAVLTVAALKAMAVPTIFARAETDRRAAVLRTVGATRVVELEHEMGERTALEIVAPATVDLIEFAGDYRVVPWTASGDWVGKTIGASGLDREYGIAVVGVRPRGSSKTGATGAPKLEPARPDYVIREGDTLLLVGEEHGVERFVSSAAQ